MIKKYGPEQSVTEEEYETIINGVRNSYDTAALSYHSLFHDELSGHKEDKKLLDDFKKRLSAGSYVCDMGCGPSAQYSAYLKGAGFEIFGVDISRECIKKAGSLHREFHFKRADMLKSGYEDEQFDGLLSFYALFHIPKEFQSRVFKEFYRMLKPGGTLLTVTHKGNFNKTLTTLWGHEQLQLFANFNTENELEEYSKEAGFLTYSVTAKKAYYEFPEERIVLFAQK